MDNAIKCVPLCRASIDILDRNHNHRQFGPVGGTSLDSGKVELCTLADIAGTNGTAFGTGEQCELMEPGAVKRSPFRAVCVKPADQAARPK